MNAEVELPSVPSIPGVAFRPIDRRGDHAPVAALISLVNQDECGTAAVRVYEALGFRRVRTSASYRKAMPGFPSQG